MRSHWRRVLMLGAVGASGLLATASPAGAHWFSGRRDGVVATEFYTVAPTAYFVPTAYVLPTSYVATTFALEATEYVLPTAYVVPTAFAYETSYVLPTTQVVATSFAVPTWAETAYQVVPTVAYETGPCDGSVMAAPEASYAAPVAPTTATPQTPTKQPAGTVPSAVRPAPVLESIPDNGPANSGQPAKPAEPATQRDTAPPAGVGSEPTPVPADPGDPTPPVAPVPERENAGELPQPAAITPIEPELGAKPPVAPGGGGNPVELPPVNNPGAFRREAQKPVMTAASRSFDARPYRRAQGVLGVLEGKVVSGDSGLPEPGVRVTLTNRAKTFVDRDITTDPSGHYSVRLPDGDWTVKVAMPSGRVYSVSQLTVSEGQISDDLGRDVPTLNITR